MMNLSMSWDELKRRAREGTSLTILADLNGVNAETMKKCIAELEKQTGEKLVFSKPEKKPKPNKVRIDRDKVIALAEQGIKASVIAEKLGTYPQAIYNILHSWRRANPEKKARKPVQKPVKTEQKPKKAAFQPDVDYTLPKFENFETGLVKIKLTKIMIDPGVADVIETNIDDLKDQIQKHLDQIEILKFQLQSWEALLNASEVVENEHKAGTAFPEVMDL